MNNYTYQYSDQQNTPVLTPRVIKRESDAYCGPGENFNKITIPSNATIKAREILALVPTSSEVLQ